jgi:hypothetical protein
LRLSVTGCHAGNRVEELAQFTFMMKRYRLVLTLLFGLARTALALVNWARSAAPFVRGGLIAGARVLRGELLPRSKKVTCTSSAFCDNYYVP